MMEQNLTQVLLHLQREMNNTHVKLERVRQEIGQVQQDLDHFFLVQMTITVFGVCYGFCC